MCMQKGEDTFHFPWQFPLYLRFRFLFSTFVKEAAAVFGAEFKYFPCFFQLSSFLHLFFSFSTFITYLLYPFLVPRTNHSFLKVFSSFPGHFLVPNPSVLLQCTLLQNSIEGRGRPGAAAGDQRVAVCGRQLRRDVHQVPDGPWPEEGLPGDAPLHGDSLPHAEGERPPGEALAVR